MIEVRKTTSAKLGQGCLVVSLAPEDVFAVTCLLSAGGARFCGSSDPKAIAWLCEEALRPSRNAFVAEAIEDGRVVGAVLAVRRELLLGLRLCTVAPGLGVRALARLALGALINVLLGRVSRMPNWLTSYGRRAAKVILVVTLASVRGRGIGTELYALLGNLVEGTGDAHWLIARLENTNTISLALHKRAGWVTMPEAGSIAAWKRLRHAP